MKTATRIALAGGLLSAALVLAGCERPPMDTEQLNYRGLALEVITNPRTQQARLAANEVPDPLPPVDKSGTKASAIYQNLEVLGDLDIAEFTRLMAAITLWVSPEEGCNYCHEGGNFASDSVYTKVVARGMLQMTRSLNSEWTQHVRGTGVTCYTCHRGQNIPANYWFLEPEGHGNRMIGYTAGQNRAAPMAGGTSLPHDPFSAYLMENARDIRVQSTTALPAQDEKGIKDAEHTYSLMMNISTSLGVGCTYCHNSRSFMPWEASSPARVTAWHGLQMVRHVNDEYLKPLAGTFPAERLGPTGDVFKVNCKTCHQGLPKPLQGMSMLADYPNLKAGSRSR